MSEFLKSEQGRKTLADAAKLSIDLCTAVPGGRSYTRKWNLPQMIDELGERTAIWNGKKGTVFLTDGNTMNILLELELKKKYQRPPF